MSKSLLIVESPAKVRTIKRYLSDDFTIESSVGHVKDLPPNRLGVAVDEGFEPEYEVISEKKKVMQKLKKAAADVDQVFLALDPDREGEAIAWHIAEELRRSRNFKGNIRRVLFHEITRRAIEESLQRPLELNRERFDAQQARRILDRLVGYQISPLLWDKVKRGLSAGRVQSVAVRLVVDREREIQAFNPEEYWSITANVEAESPPIFDAKLIRWQGKKAKLSNETDTQEVLDHVQDRSFAVHEVQKKERRRNPSPPFITSKLQQEAARKFNFTARRTMQIAQQLYEGLELGEEGPTGLITYMRTDSTRISDEAVTNVRMFIETRYGAEYLPEKPVVYAKKKRAQDAHEAIRPTYIDQNPEDLKDHLTREQYLLYDLIWKRFVSCQMKPAIFDQTVVDIAAGDAIFRTTGQVMRFDGHTRVYTEGRAERNLAANAQMDPEQNVEQDNSGASLPEVVAGDALEVHKITPQQHFTQPPKRFSESTLVKELEEKGIGRPSTYASILSVIQDKHYVEKREGRFFATELGFLVTDLLVEHFTDVLDVTFTAQMEERLDLIEEGEQDWKALLEQFHNPFQETLTKAQDEMRNIKKEGQKTDLICEKCNSPMVIKWGRNGQFLACSAYPECKNTKDFTRDDKGLIVVKEPTADELEAAGTCHECSASMVVKTGKFGRFLACSRYPECKVTMPFKVGVACPREDCNDGDLVEKRSRKGKLFYSCSNYPECDYALWDRPVATPCPTCEHPFLVEALKKRKNRPAGIYCPNEECEYRKEE